MIRAIADTHAVVWYLGADPRLSVTARSTISSAAAAGMYIGVSSITIIEMIYLIEKDRIDSARLPQLLTALDQRRAVLQIVPIDRAVAEALQRVVRAEIPEMGDRIIAATALQLGVPVITRDTTLTLSSISTIW